MDATTSTSAQVDPAATPSDRVSDTPLNSSRTAKRQGRVEMSVHQIVEQAEKKPAPFRSGLLLSLSAGLVLWACYPPLDWAFLAWLAPLPWLMLVRLNKPTRWQSFAAYLGGLAFTVPALQWMRYGDPLMYIGWIALAAYVAAYVPVFIGLCRVATHRWKLSLLWTAPVIWVGLEYLRGWLLTGFGWYYLGHTQYRWVELIQISDLVGGYGVSFLVMLFSAAVALQIPPQWFQTLRLLPYSTGSATQLVQTPSRPWRALVISLGCLAIAVGYGFWRRSAAEFTVGPRVALIQGDFRAALNIPPSQYEESFNLHNELTGYAVPHQPDLIVWPEGMFRWGLQTADPTMSAADLTQVAPYFAPESWQRKDVHNALTTMSEKAGAAMVIGLGTYAATPEKLHQYNSAQLITPDEGLTSRYDKLHRVPFGEYIPGKDSFPGLFSFVPEHFGLSAGKSAAVFEYQDWRFAPVICFEDTVPHVTRNIVHSIESASSDAEPVDFLVNLSNDGWFAGSSEHDQHLITAQFRAVELRKPLVRAANMGISSFIDGDGVVLTPEVFLTKDSVSYEKRAESFRDPRTGTYRRNIPAVAVHNIPLDSRRSLYLVTGDYFAATCLLFCGGLFLSRWWPQRQSGI